MGTNPAFRRLLVVVKQTAYEEYSQASCTGTPTGISYELTPLLTISFNLNFVLASLSSVREAKRPKPYDGNVLNLATRHISDASTI